MRKLLDMDIEHIRILLSVLKVHHRMARSLDFLGSALKVIAGTPDVTDLEKVKLSESKLVDANNRQIVINLEIQKQINKLKDTINEIKGQYRRWPRDHYERDTPRHLPFLRNHQWHEICEPA